MTHDLVFEGLTVSSHVIETITQVAADKVDGVVAIRPPATTAAGLLKPKPSGIEIKVDDDAALTIAVHLTVAYGQKLPDLGAQVQTAVRDALVGQLGVSAVSVDVFIDALTFEG
ncbi:MAG: Asp23/Gls24 family envelope stress response protein [Actinomycetes bacterium]|jgi:uncharacterized alkaline shock family protein YloU|nr:Asp23/Gls24 family envelope stress response protein [Actinomycetes bacterium]